MRRLLVLLCVVFCSAWLLCACTKEPAVTAIAVKGFEEGGTYEMLMGDFDYAAHMLVVSYDSGESEEIALSEEMLAEGDALKFYQEGEHSLTVTHGGQTATLKICVKRNEITGVGFPQQLSFTYNGKPHAVELEGDIPAGVTVTYPRGNSFVNAGTYDVTAVLTGDTYVTKSITATVTVERASYDMSGVRFEGGTFVYNGKKHSLAVAGTLPEGVSKPIYHIGGTQTAGATEAGSYLVTASFASSDPNYHPVPDMQAQLTISKATHNVEGLRLCGFDEEGEQISGARRVYDGSAVTVRIADTSLLPKGTAVFYRVSKNGGEPSEETAGVSFTGVGVYTVTASFMLADDKNYCALEPITLSFEVARADYDMSGVYFDHDACVYDGEMHALRISGTLPEGVGVTYRYYLGDKQVAQGAVGVSPAGSYTVKAVFAHGNENYNEIAEMTATLEIRRCSIDVSAVTYETNAVFEYDGTAKMIAVYGIPEGVEAEKKLYRVVDGADPEQIALDGAVASGDYMLTVRMYPTDAENYTVSNQETVSIRFSIRAAE